MPKTTKPKNDPGKSYSVTDTLVEIDVVVETIEEMQNNMDVLNKNMQHAIDKIESRADAFYIFDACQLTDTVATSAASPPVNCRRLFDGLISMN